jgi:hypothetical protein
MPAKQRKEPQREIRQFRNKKDTGDIVEFGEIGVVVRDDDTVILAAEGYRTIIDLQDNFEATDSEPARTYVRVRFELAPYVAPTEPTPPVGAPAVVPLDPEELTPDE